MIYISSYSFGKQSIAEKFEHHNGWCYIHGSINYYITKIILNNKILSKEKTESGQNLEG